jgi:hypothetical protein
VLLEVTTWNIDHGGQNKSGDTGDQHRWEAALGLAAKTFAGPNPNRVIFVQEAFLWGRLGRTDRFAKATNTTPYVAAGRNDLDLVAFVGPGLAVGAWKANPAHLNSPTVVVPVRPDGWDHQIVLATTHLDPWSANTRFEQVLALNSLLRDELVLLGGDINCIGLFDPEPNIAEIPDWQVYCHETFTDVPVWNRRPTELAARAGWVDLAHRFGEHHLPTGGFGEQFPLVRFDQLWASPDLAALAVGYEVHGSDEFTKVSDHLPVTARFELPGPQR